ncbi:uncharacterized protein LOC109715246 isoform X2 [Ananas comosus]|uniref:Uncharacterized protein LOC109715246 isoform X2 n=1 Tax=Ananas comosus TaxID=4615 RepID=A0A6P5FIJ4_ANACO|nr:uncharacterized protein LOC109715246 isoform X2 [Ananas comosus]
MTPSTSRRRMRSSTPPLASPPRGERLLVWMIFFLKFTRRKINLWVVTLRDQMHPKAIIQMKMIKRHKKTRSLSASLLTIARNKRVNEIGSEDEVPEWGQKVFGLQKSPTSLGRTGLENCQLLQSFTENSLAQILGVNAEQGETFLKGLLMNGWLSKLAFRSGLVEESIARWSFHTMLYSLNEELQVSACDFWCCILQSRDEANQPLVRLGWYPNYSALKDALLNYGYLFDTTSNCSSTSEASSADSECDGPPANILSWIRVLSACFQLRNGRTIFSTSEAEDFLIIVICLFLDRKLVGITSILSECLQSIIGSFSDSQWDESCVKVAESIAHRVPKDLNCLRIVECISGLDNRNKHLRSQLALQMLRISFDRKVTNAKEALEMLKLVNVKNKDCNFFKLYIYLVLVENLLLFDHPFEEKSLIIDLWSKYLRNCSTQITSTDLRSYASKVRNKASYLLQNMILKNCG